MSSEPLQASPSPVDARRFCQACGRFPTGVAIATVLDAGGEPHGLTVNSFTSVSLRPPMVLICIDHGAAVLPHFRQCKHFGVNVLNEYQREVSEHFARRGRDRFTGVEWHAGQTGVPLLRRGLAFIECELQHRVPAGDHDVFIGAVLYTKIEEGRPLIYFASEYRRLEQAGSC